MDDFLDDILSEPSSIKAPAPKFQPKASPRSKKGSSSSVPSVSAIASKEQLVTSVAVDSKSNQFVHPNEFVDKNLDVPNSSSFAGSSGTKLTSFSKETSNLDEVLIDGNSSTEAREVVESASTECTVNFISKSSGDGHLVADDFSCSEVVSIMSDSNAASGKRAVKYQPKPKAQSSRKMDSAHVPDSPKGHPENQHMKAVDSIHVGEPDTISKLSHVGVDGEETTAAQPDTLVLEDIDSWMPPNLPEESGKQGNRKMSDALNLSHESLNKGPGLSGNEASEHEYVFLDGENEGFQYNSSSPAKVLDEPTVNRDENDHEEDHLGGETSKKKRQQKQKTIASENDKQIERGGSNPRHLMNQLLDLPRSPSHYSTKKICGQVLA